MTIKAKAKYVFLTILPYIILYFLLQSALVINTSHNLTTDLDKLIPFVPEFIWIYHSMIPIFILTTVVLIEKKPVFFTAIASIIFASIIMLLFYTFFPAFYPRDGHTEASVSGFLVEVTRSIDGSNNTFPSGHVTFAWLMVFFIGLSNFAQKYKWIQLAYIVWAFLVSASTLVLKQHFILDVFSGISLATLCYFLGKYLVFERMLATN
jgi:membrane-associated phospholipid phosphatase